MALSIQYLLNERDLVRSHPDSRTGYKEAFCYSGPIFAAAKARLLPLVTCNTLFSGDLTEWKNRGYFYHERINYH